MRAGAVGVAVLATALAWPMFATAEDLAVSAAFAEAGRVDPGDGLTLVLSRPVAKDEGRLAVLVGTTDWTSLFHATDRLLDFRADPVPLPEGPTEISVHLVSPEGAWRELARFPVTIEEFDVSRVAPSIDVSVKGQVGEGHDPDDAAPPREVPFQDVTGQGGFETELVRGDFSMTTNLRVMGVSRIEEALRFGDLGSEAPKLDLAGYTFGLGKGPVLVQLGDVSHGSNRYLMDGFGSRGLSLRAGVAGLGDLTLAAVNGTAIVGWRNFFGLSRSQHRVVSGTLGLELDRDRPGGLRLEATGMKGSVLPLADFTQGVVNDAAESQGYGARLIASDPSGRLRVDGSWARSRFTNPQDPALAQGESLVAVAETSSDAVFAGAALDVLRAIPVGGGGRSLNLGLTYSFERVDPLYRSVAAITQADLMRHALGATLSVGEMVVQATHLRSEDNLGEVASILKTLTRVSGASVTLPTSTFGPADAEPSPWAPVLSYAVTRTHQVGDGVPPDSGFDPSHVPDQLSVNHSGGIVWQAQRVSVGYTVNHSSQDNRQPGREAADFDTFVHGITLDLLPGETLSVGLDLGLEEAKNLAEERTDELRRVGVSLDWRLPKGFSVTGLVSTSRNEDDAEASEARNTEIDVLAAWRHVFSGERETPVLSLSLRVARQSARLRQLLFGIDDARSAWQVSTGVSLSAFR